MSSENIRRLEALVDDGELDETSMVLVIGAYNTHALHPNLWVDIERDPTIELGSMEAILVMAGIEIPWKTVEKGSSNILDSGPN